MTLAPYLYENAIPNAKFIFGITQILGEKCTNNSLKSVRNDKKKKKKNSFSGTENTYLP